MSHGILHFVAFILLLIVSVGTTGNNRDLIDLGKNLFSNPNLSKNRNVSCMTCHNPDYAFIDPRKHISNGAISKGTSRNSLGRRNAPTLTYALLTPSIKTDKTGPIGGLFFDGRANSFEEQIAHPLFDENEMGLAGEEMLYTRITENTALKKQIVQVFGGDVLKNATKILSAVQTSIAAFERSTEFSAFDSKYDRFLEGTYVMSTQEKDGYNLFFSDVTNCMNCHLLHKGTLSKKEPFTDLRYHNIGLPVNQELLKEKVLGSYYNDKGLAENPVFSHTINNGKFKTPTLRNIAITPPYMHNGIFQELETTILFYNIHLMKNESALTNPKTQKHWGNPENPDNVDSRLLALGQPLDADRVDSIVAFLKLLTDKKYEHLLNKK